jgi:hypothetical protein
MEGDVECCQTWDDFVRRREYRSTFDFQQFTAAPMTTEGYGNIFKQHWSTRFAIHQGSQGEGPQILLASASGGGGRSEEHGHIEARRDRVSYIGES